MSCLALQEGSLQHRSADRRHLRIRPLLLALQPAQAAGVVQASTPRNWATCPRSWTATSRTRSSRPCSLFQSGKMLQPQLNLVFKIEFAEAADTLWLGGSGSASYSIENVRVLAFQVRMDSALVESFNKVLLSGRSMVFSYSTMHTQVFFDPGRRQETQRHGGQYTRSSWAPSSPSKMTTTPWARS